MESETRQDSFIGQRFGEGGHLEVIGWDGVSRANSKSKGRKGARKYSVKCTVCAGDAELFGDGVFFCFRDTLNNKGGIPCGCSNTYKWSPQQYETLIARKCKGRGYTLTSGKLPADAKSKTRISLLCSEGHEWSMEIDSFINRGQRCKKCTHKGRILSDEQYSELFMASGKFSEGTTFVRSFGEDLVGRCWTVFCPKCSTDDFALSGYCDGRFTARASNLRKGLLPCRCSTTYRGSKDFQEFRVRREAEKSGETFLRWCEEFSGVFTKLEIECTKHGPYTTTVSNFVSAGSRCPSCALRGFQRELPGCVYVLKICSQSVDFTGYGISNQPERRIQTHRANLLKHGFVIDDMQLFYTSGKIAVEVENEIKNRFERFPQKVDGFKKEATFNYLYLDLVKFIDEQILKKENA